MQKGIKSSMFTVGLILIILFLSFLIVRKNRSMERSIPPMDETRELDDKAQDIPDLWRENLRRMGIKEFKEVRNVPEISIIDLDGNKVSLSQFRDKVVILEFWASWCHYCVKSMPNLEKLYEKFRDKGFVVLAVTVSKSPENVKEFKQDYQLTFPFLLDPEGNLFRFFKVRPIPHFVLIDRGRIIGEAIGMRDWYSKEAQALIEDMVEIE